MNEVIPFIGQVSAEEQHQWLQLLNAAMPDETVLAIDKIPEDQYQYCRIAIVANPNPADVALFKELKWLHSLWAGVEKILASLNNPPKIVRLIDPQLRETMAEAALAWCFYLQRDMPAYAKLQRQKRWQPLDYRPADQTRVGILGLGELGMRAAQRLKDNGFQVSGWSRSAKQIDEIETFSGDTGLQDILQQSDILLCLLPLTASTRALLNAERLALLPRGASVINFARGPIIESQALVNSLDRGHLKHAVLDVFDQEPLPRENPLWAHSAITILPHISAPTTMESATKIVAKNIGCYRQTGELPTAVDISRGY